MSKEDLVLEYSIIGLPHPNGSKIRLFSTGRVEVVGIGMDFNTMTDVNGKIIKNLRIPPEQVQSYAKRLVEANFFNYQHFPAMMFDGLVETMTLNYLGKSRTIDSGNETHPSLFPDIVQELEALVKQQE
jgi:hypothetical protein